MNLLLPVQMDVELQSVVGLLEATLKARPAQITRELPAVLQVLMPLLHSPLAAPRIQQVFLDIGVCLMPKHLHSLGTRLLQFYLNKCNCVLGDSVLHRTLFPPCSCARGSCDVTVTEA